MAETTVNGLRFELFKRTNTAIVKNVAQGFKNQYTFDIPETVTSEGTKFCVTEIGVWAFYGCKSLTSITIPNSVTNIGWGAFCDCKSLTSINISNSVTSIGESAFCDCESLTSITIPNSVTSIGVGAFKGCSSLTAIMVDANNMVYDSRENSHAIIETATNCLIRGCQNTVIPDSVTTIGDRAFFGCKSLTSINIPNSVTTIGDRAFCDCKSLTSITIPNSVTSIGVSIFSGCESLTSITIPSSVTSIGDSAFSGCESLTSITIPGSVTSIGDSAFSGCSSLTAIMVDANNMVYDSRENSHAIIETATSCLIRGCQNTVIPDSVTTIGDRAFSLCKSLTSITIPNSVTSIGVGAFSGCKSLTSITIPNSVTSIGEMAFQGCKSLTSITIPNSVTSIGWGAFFDCDKLTSVTIENEKGKVKIGDDAVSINYVGKPKGQPAKPIENPYHQAIREAEEAVAKAAEKTTVNVETTPEPSQPVSPTTTQTRNRDKANYVFNGKVYTKKVQLVHDLVLHHLSLHPDLTHEQLKKDFQVQKNMDVMFMSYEMYLSTLAEKGIVYFFESKTEEDTIALQDAKILISSNWPTMVGGKPSVFAKLLDKAKELGYEITVQD